MMMLLMRFGGLRCRLEFVPFEAWRCKLLRWPLWLRKCVCVCIYIYIHSRRCTNINININIYIYMQENPLCII